MKITESTAAGFADWFRDVVQYAPQTTAWERAPWRVGVSQDRQRLAVCPTCQARASARGFFGLFIAWVELERDRDGGRQCVGGCDRWAPLPPTTRLS